MKNVKALLHNYLTAMVFLAIYLLMAVVFLFLEGFEADSQLNLITVLAPCMLLGLILDYIIKRNTILSKGQKLFTHLLPVGIFLLLLLARFSQIIDRSLPDYYNYLYYFFIAGPFMMVSYRKEDHRKRMIFSLIGVAVVFAFYLNLTTKTENLEKGTGLFIFMISYFMMFYAASAIRRLPYLPLLLGLINTGLLWYLYRNPLSLDGLPHNWDYDYLLYFEYLMLGCFVLCILARLLAEFIHKEERQPQKV